MAGAHMHAARAQVLSKVKGKALVGTTYQPLFPYFAHLKAQAALPNGSCSQWRPPGAVWGLQSDLRRICEG